MRLLGGCVYYAEYGISMYWSAFFFQDNLPILQLGKSSEMEPGEMVIVIGSPKKVNHCQTRCVCQHHRNLQWKIWQGKLDSALETLQVRFKVKWSGMSWRVHVMYWKWKGFTQVHWSWDCFYVYYLKQGLYLGFTTTKSLLYFVVCNTYKVHVMCWGTEWNK